MVGYRPNKSELLIESLIGLISLLVTHLTINI